MFRALRKLWGGEPKAAPPKSPMLPPDPEPEAITVPEVSAAELLAMLAEANPPLLVDVREPYEWRQVRIAASAGYAVQHIPMSELPDRTVELPAQQPLVVICAHGSRSYSVAAWLLEQNIPASSLTGGITAWTRQGGPIEQG